MKNVHNVLYFIEIEPKNKMRADGSTNVAQIMWLSVTEIFRVNIQF